jgi:hypothetical protein
MIHKSISFQSVKRNKKEIPNKSDRNICYRRMDRSSRILLGEEVKNQNLGSNDEMIEFVITQRVLKSLSNANCFFFNGANFFEIEINYSLS